MLPHERSLPAYQRVGNGRVSQTLGVDLPHGSSLQGQFVPAAAGGDLSNSPTTNDHTTRDRSAS